MTVVECKGQFLLRLVLISIMGEDLKCGTLLLCSLRSRNSTFPNNICMSPDLMSDSVGEQWRNQLLPDEPLGILVKEGCLDSPPAL